MERHKVEGSWRGNAPQRGEVKQELEGPLDGGRGVGCREGDASHMHAAYTWQCHVPAHQRTLSTACTGSGPGSGGCLRVGRG